MVFNKPSGPNTNAEPFAVPMMDKKRKSLHLHLGAEGHSGGHNQPPRKRAATSVLASPDIKKLSSPALEKLIWRNFEQTSSLNTPLITPSLDFLAAKTPVEARDFLKGFDETMMEVKKTHDPNLCSVAIASEEDSNSNNNSAEMIGHENAMLLGDLIELDAENSGSKLYHVVPLSSCDTSSTSTTGSYYTTATGEIISCGGITAIPMMDDGSEEHKSYAELQTSYLHHQTAGTPSLETTTYMEIPTVSAAPPNSVPIVAKETASFALTSGGKLLNIKFEVPFPGETDDQHHIVTATKSKPPPVDEYLPTTISGNDSSSDMNYDAMNYDMNDDDDEDWKADTTTSSKGKSKRNRKGNTRPIPTDLSANERRKLERKRERNRIAATKCRQRKMDRIQELEHTVKKQKGENSDLRQMVIKLKKDLAGLKAVMIDHVNAGCQIIVSPEFILDAARQQQQKSI